MYSIKKTELQGGKTEVKLTARPTHVLRNMQGFGEPVFVLQMNKTFDGLLLKRIGPRAYPARLKRGQRRYLQFCTFHGRAVPSCVSGNRGAP